MKEKALTELNTKSYWDWCFANGQWESNSGREQTRLFAKHLLRHIDVPFPRFSMLDVGCALGDAVAIWHERYPDAELYGCDVSDKAIEKAKQTYGRVATFFSSGYDSLDGRWDIITCSNVLEHVNNPSAVAETLLSHCSILYVMTPYREIGVGRPGPGFSHVSIMDEHSFDDLLTRGVAGTVNSTVFECPGAWGPRGSWLRRRLVHAALSMLSHRRLPEILSFPRQIAFTIRCI